MNLNRIEAIYEESTSGELEDRVDCRPSFYPAGTPQAFATLGFYLFPIIIYAICKLKNKNIKLEEGFATFEIRAIAYMVDFGLIFLFDFLIKLLYANLSSPPPVAPIILSMLFSFTNMIILPTITGWSLGKRILGIQLVKKDQKKAEFFDVIYREIVKGFISVPIIYLGCLWMLFGEGKLTWHDSVADIRVVKIRALS